MNERLKSVADNQALVAELKEFFHRFFAVDTLNLEGSNIEIGEMVRSRLEGRALLDKAFKELERYRTPEVRKPEPNPAR